ncbi:nuclear transport factor 2 family protein [Halostella salina]|uniref:nuclear transport factor 2 family protein n=1 Tax=Halostella salina TaxID=1547897 RepID=UPI000EF7D8F5|nr:nuclear transport factor 2 family protein [Halostella salina]
MADAEATVRAYYAALDEGAYGDLESLLAPDFVQHRPDRTFEGREAFVAFMRDDRPMTDTTHELLTVFVAGDAVAVRGRLLDADGEPLFPFVDVHELDGDGRIERLETFTR